MMSLDLVVASLEEQEMYTPLHVVCSEIIITPNADIICGTFTRQHSLKRFGWLVSIALNFLLVWFFTKHEKGILPITEVET